MINDRRIARNLSREDTLDAIALATTCPDLLLTLSKILRHSQAHLDIIASDKRLGQTEIRLLRSIKDLPGATSKHSSKMVCSAWFSKV